MARVTAVISYLGAAGLRARSLPREAGSLVPREN